MLGPRFSCVHLLVGPNMYHHSFYILHGCCRAEYFEVLHCKSFRAARIFMSPFSDLFASLRVELASKYQCSFIDAVFHACSVLHPD